MLTRTQIEKSEDQNLASYAMKSKYTRGRLHDEPEHEYRSCFQRDRDRIIHSTAFRRLEYKTQVFVNHEGDYYRTRLTHTLEVSQISRSIARTLMLNEDLTEALSLSHDLGHPPFGHAGEDTLQDLMKDHGGFEHNEQSLRVVDVLEKRYPYFEGLNLTWETREGIIKHTSEYDHPKLESMGFMPNFSPPLEAQIVDIADEIAYNNHDLDDGLTAKLVELNSLNDVTVWKKIYNTVDKKYKGLDNERKKYITIKTLINMQVTDVISCAEQNLKERKIQSLDDVRKFKERLVCFSEDMTQKNKELKTFLLENLYRNYRVTRMGNKANRFIKSLFKTYLENPKQLPPNTQKRIQEEDPYRVVCDYIAGMTDRYALDEYNKLFGPYEKV